MASSSDDCTVFIIDIICNFMDVDSCLSNCIFLILNQVGEVWIQHLWQFCQPLNLFLSRGFVVDLGYLKAGQVSIIRSSINELLLLLQLNGGSDAKSYFRRYMRVDPPVTEETIRRHRANTENNPAFKSWKQFTLI